MRVLVGCEYSGRVRQAFRKLGFDAWSCDLLTSEDNSPHHYQCDVRDVVGLGWDLFICHPECTYLASSGLHWNTRVSGRAEKTEQALEFVRYLLRLPIPRIALENPQGCIGTRIRPADQYVQPYEFGDDASKKTGLWLKNLPPLKPTQHIEPRWICCGIQVTDKYGCPNCCGDKAARPRWGNQTDRQRTKQITAKRRPLEGTQQNIRRYSERHGRPVGCSFDRG
jgi:hypothetical protein